MMLRVTWLVYDPSRERRTTPPCPPVRLCSMRSASGCASTRSGVGCSSATINRGPTGSATTMMTSAGSTPTYTRYGPPLPRLFPLIFSTHARRPVVQWAALFATMWLHAERTERSCAGGSKTDTCVRALCLLLPNSEPRTTPVESALCARVRRGLARRARARLHRRARRPARVGPARGRRGARRVLSLPTDLAPFRALSLS